MAYYRCPKCKGYFSVPLIIDPFPLTWADYPPMLCPICGTMSKSVPFVQYLFGKKIEKQTNQ